MRRTRRPAPRRRLALGGLAGAAATLCLCLAALVAAGRGRPAESLAAANALASAPQALAPTRAAAPTPRPSPSPALAPLPAGYPALPAGLTAARVVNVIDGDTVDVLIGEQRERLRLIGIDTPETVHPSKPVMCYGREASDRAKALLYGQDVLLEEDRSQDSRDRYGRLLRYVWLPDGRLFNLDMVADGYAHEYTYREPYRYRDAFVAAQARARDEGRGLWSPSTCAGQDVPAGASPAPATARPAQPAPTSPPPPPPSGQSAPPALPPSYNGCADDPNASAAPNNPVRIVAVDKRAETVTLQNVGAAPVSLDGWVMCSVKGKQRHDIGGTLAAGETRTFRHGGKNIWNNSERDPGLLYDPQGRLVSAWPD